MSRTFRKNPDHAYFRSPHTQKERRQLTGLQADARLHQVAISPVNRLSRTLPSNFDDLKVASFAESFFDD